MSASLAQVILLILLGAVYLPVIFFAIQRRDEGQGAATWLVVLYALLAMVINFTEAVWQNREDPLILQEVQTYISFALAIVLILTLQAFMKSEFWWAWLVYFGAWALGLALILTNALNLPETLWTNGELILYRSRLGPAWTILGWVVLSIAMIINLSNAQRQSRQPLLRGRLAYWWAPVFVTLISDILLFSSLLTTGQPLRWLVAVGMAYVVGTHYVPDLKAITRRVLIYVLSTITIVGFYSAGYLIVQALFGAGKNFNPLLAGAVVALLIALIFTPLNALIARAITTWMKGDQYDASLTIHQYSESISNILEMDRLSSVAIGIMLEAMQIDRGFLFLVDAERQADGRRTYKIRSARSPEERQLVAAELDEDGTIASYFIR